MTLPSGEIHLQKGHTRRAVLKKGAATVAGVAGIALTALETKAAPIPKNNLELPPLNPESLSNIEVIGAENPITTIEEITNLTNDLDTKFKEKYPDAFPPNQPFSPSEKRKEILDEGKRFLQISVKKSVFDTFKKEAEENGINIASWFQLHVEEMNRMIAQSNPDAGLKTELKRIIILDDSFPVSGNMYGPSFPTPLDIDALWHQSENPRGEWNPTTDMLLKGSSYRQIQTLNSKKVIIDYGLIHEWFHALYSIPDEYIQNINYNFNGVPNLFINGDGYGGSSFIPGNDRRTPWTAYFLKRAKEEKIRGYFTDTSKTGADLGVFTEKPQEITVNFKSADGQTMDGDVYVRKVISDKEGKKLFDVNRLLSKENTQSKLDEAFYNASSLGETQFVTSFLMQLIHKGELYALQIPVAAFNMSKIAGKDAASYTIKFYNEGTTPLNKTQQLEIIDKSEIEKYNLPTPYASMEIEGTNALYYWYLY